MLPRLAAFGQFLVRQMMPEPLQGALASLSRNPHSPASLLLVADRDASLLWELLHDGERFLADRVILGRWLQEQESHLPYEFPVGQITVGHFAEVTEPERRAELLEVPGAPAPLLLPGGVLDDTAMTETLRGLHLLHHESPDTALADAPIPVEKESQGSLEQRIRLRLHRSHPLVTLGCTRTQRPAPTGLEQAWASAFLGAGCGAFVAPLWTVSPRAEAAFYSQFYTRLWAGDSLGAAFFAARRLVQITTPETADSLAFVLYGDPMARPYRPVSGQGYAVVEPIGRGSDDPLPPGVPARFRVSLRRTPPVWHENQVIETAEELSVTAPSAYIIAFGMETTPKERLALRRTPNGEYLGWFTLTAPAAMIGETGIVRVNFTDNETPFHSLTFAIPIEPGD
jgi:hypothetical protein